MLLTSIVCLIVFWNSTDRFLLTFNVSILHNRLRRLGNYDRSTLYNIFTMGFTGT